MTVRKEDYANAKRMNGNHKELRLFVKQLSESSAAICREQDASKARELMSDVIQKVKSRIGQPIEEFQSKEHLTESRDKWRKWLHSAKTF